MNQFHVKNSPAKHHFLVTRATTTIIMAVITTKAPIMIPIIDKIPKPPSKIQLRKNYSLDILLINSKTNYLPSTMAEDELNLTL